MMIQTVQLGSNICRAYDGMFHFISDAVQVPIVGKHKVCASGNNTGP